VGQRYRHNYQETGDIIDPSFFVLDNNELAGEVNGSMDRDNLPASTIAQNEIVAGAFTTVTAYGSETSFAPDITITGWQGGTANNAFGIFYITTEECEVDCVVDVHVSLAWRWANAAASFNAAYPWEADTIEFRLLVDGIEVCRAGPFEDVHDRYATFLMGQLVVTAGFRTIAVECLAARRQYEGLDITAGCTDQPTITSRRMIVIQERR
jgi:hypothetical protein